MYLARYSSTGMVGPPTATSNAAADEIKLISKAHLGGLGKGSRQFYASHPCECRRSESAPHPALLSALDPPQADFGADKDPLARTLNPSGKLGFAQSYGWC